MASWGTNEMFIIILITILIYLRCIVKKIKANLFCGLGVEGFLKMKIYPTNSLKNWWHLNKNTHSTITTVLLQISRHLISKILQEVQPSGLTIIDTGYCWNCIFLEICILILAIVLWSKVIEYEVPKCKGSLYPTFGNCHNYYY